MGLRSCGHTCWTISLTQVRYDGSVSNGGDKKEDVNSIDLMMIGYGKVREKESVKNTFKFLAHVPE